jgi:hypothetical protein
VTLADRLRALADALPDGASVTLSAAQLRAWLAEESTAPLMRVSPEIIAPTSAEDWRARFWSCPDETRLGVRELAEALGRSADWCYRACSPKWATARRRDPLPCSRLDGVLVFRAGAVRRWVQSSEIVVHPSMTLLNSGAKQRQ